MIDLYTWMTDNGYKGCQAMEESGLPYKLNPICLPKREQFNPAFLAISPGHKIPAIVDPEGPGGQKVTLCESGAILKYVGEKADNGLYPRDPATRVKVDQWLFYGSATFTTLAQQFGTWVVRNPEKVPAAMKHYDTVIRDMLGTLDRHLATNEYVAGTYSIADMAMYPDVHLHGVKDIGLNDYPNLKRWHDAIEARPAIQKAWGPFPS